MGCQEWRTPPELFAALNSEFAFDIDAMATADDALLGKFITPEMDGLAASTPWFVYDNKPLYSAYCNPGFRRLKDATRKAYHEVERNAGCVAVVVALCNPSTEWWQNADLDYPADEIRLLGGQRVSYIDPRTGEPGTENMYESSVIIYRKNPLRRRPRITTWYWAGTK